MRIEPSGKGYCDIPEGVIKSYQRARPAAAPAFALIPRLIVWQPAFPHGSRVLREAGADGLSASLGGMSFRISALRCRTGRFLRAANISRIEDATPIRNDEGLASETGNSNSRAKSAAGR
jgi:hypothetical protein